MHGIQADEICLISLQHVILYPSCLTDRYLDVDYIVENQLTQSKRIEADCWPNDMISRNKGIEGEDR
jgi:hypothetical protein